LDISTSGMVAQRTRLQAIAANIANKDTILDSHGNLNPYRARRVHLAPGDPTAATVEGQAMGVHVESIEIDQAPFNLRWDPGNPYAYKEGPNAGYVPNPNVSMVMEQVSAVEAARAYEANIAAAEITKTMMTQALRLLA